MSGRGRKRERRETGETKTCAAMRLCPARLSPPGGSRNGDGAREAGLEKIGRCGSLRAPRPTSCGTLVPLDQSTPSAPSPFYGALMRDRTFTSEWWRTEAPGGSLHAASRAQPGSNAPPPAASQLTGIIARFRTTACMDTQPKPVVMPAEALSAQLQAAGIVPHNRKRRPPPAPGRLTNASNRRGRREYGTGRRGGENWGE
ncbi:hypothetical protein RHIZ404_230370 [Rhizobium sp. EC-SD404]|nr:hypothetical protein RHIZ404_230370 [Rhizobium sp. EC-SD404]